MSGAPSSAGWRHSAPTLSQWSGISIIRGRGDVVTRFILLLSADAYAFSPRTAQGLGDVPMIHAVAARMTSATAISQRIDLRSLAAPNA
jgi:hypothetical protein